MPWTRKLSPAEPLSFYPISQISLVPILTYNQSGLVHLTFFPFSPLLSGSPLETQEYMQDSNLIELAKIKSSLCLPMDTKVSH